MVPRPNILPSELIQRGWCQRDSAQNADGESVDIFSPNAVRFSYAGAFNRAIGPGNEYRGNEYGRRVVEAMNKGASGLPFTRNEDPDQEHHHAIKDALRAEAILGWS